MPSKILISKHEWESLGSRGPSTDSMLKRNHSSNDANLKGEDRTGRTSKKPKKTKDPNKPKHPVSAYLFFTAAVRPRLRAQGVPVSGATLGALWRSHENKRMYEFMAAEDSARFWREMATYEARELLRSVTPPLPDSLC
jgi:hypothetical protein